MVWKEDDSEVEKVEEEVEEGDAAWTTEVTKELTIGRR